MNFRRKVTKTVAEELFKDYLEGMVIDLPKLESNIDARNTIVEQSKGWKDNAAHKYVRDLVLETSMRTTAFQSKDEIEVAFNRGMAHGMQLYEKRLQELASTNTKNDKQD